MAATNHRAAPAPFATGPVLGVAAAVAAVLTALFGRYGYHRDELYFLAAGDHPAWGYADQPPLTPLLARAATAVFGNSPAGLRVPATLACAAVVVLVAALARELGGGRAAQLLAACCAAASGLVLGTGHMVSTTTFDLLAWLLICLLVLRALRTGDGRRWWAVGAAAGIGLLNKYLVVLLLVVLVAAVLAVGPRRTLRGGWWVAGAAVAAAPALPNVGWQAAHGWPQLTVAGGISSDDGAENRLMFVPQQIVYLSPLFVPVWIAGWRRLWRDPALRRPAPCPWRIRCRARWCC
ncbi:glycosyltransferase family 39 protein [Streptomyces sp. NPDC019937]|uniref:glycosyltransferase family 39 protein n=1 Tax=Streptomyces sp. NPDC019937 TaxID=3154787 RepID=UPI0033CDDCCB